MAGSDRTLTEYRRKRDFRRTREPEGKGGGGNGRAPVFVVQIHDATTMHFDFRLEVDGVLKSWSVPKGPSGDPHDKRLAMPTEDHPLEYRDFEGTIAPGEYGAGTVIIWDEGRYENRSTDKRGHEIPFAEALDAGHASFRLAGRKLHGDWALTRFRKGADGEREAWLLVRHGHTARGGTPDPRRARSARSGRTLKKVAEEVAEEAAEGAKTDGEARRTRRGEGRRGGTG